MSVPEDGPTADGAPVARHMVRLSPQPVCLVGPDGRVVAASPAFGDLAGVAPAELAGRHLRELVSETDGRVEDALVLWRGSGSWRPGPLRLTTADPEPDLPCRGARIAGTDLVLVEATRQSVDDLAALTRDVELANRRRMEARLQRSLAALEAANQRLEAINAELDRYASVVAHDIRTPFNAIGRFTDLLLEDHGDALDDDAQRMLGAIARLAGRGEEVTAALLSLARIGEPRLVPEGTDSNDVAARVRADLEAMILAAQAEVTFGDLPDTAIQPVHLERVLTNLLTNALKYGTDGGPPRVVVDAERVGDLVRFTVTDEGPGIPEGERERIFDPLVRGEAARDRPGTGVGLATCRRIVEAYGGRIGVVDPGAAGATVAFTVPGVGPREQGPEG